MKYSRVHACVGTNLYSTEQEEGAPAAPVNDPLPPGRVQDKDMR